MTEREDTIERIERVLKLTRKKSITVIIPRLTAEQAVSLLKEQEAVEPKEIINDFYPVGDYRRTLGWHCGKCGRTLMGDGDFCSYCGQAVKWE